MQPIKQRMTETNEHPLIMATRRVMEALGALEHKLQQVSVARDRELAREKQISQFARENENLKEERENLNDVIARLTGQYQDLQKVATSIHGKLDDSVKKITQILEG